jgi:hypothetical protein
MIKAIAPKILVHTQCTNKILKIYTNICSTKSSKIVKYWYPLKILQMHEITASHENCGGNLLRKIAREICCGELLRKFAAENCCRHTKFMRQIIYDRNMADVEMSPGKIPAPLKFPHLSKIQAEKYATLLLFGLGRISNC